MGTFQAIPYLSQYLCGTCPVDYVLLLETIYHSLASVTYSSLGSPTNGSLTPMWPLSRNLILCLPLNGAQNLVLSLLLIVKVIDPNIIGNIYCS